MFVNNSYQYRLKEWVSFREGLETSKKPFYDILEEFRQIPLVSIQVDPYDKSTWTDPWTMILENEFCNFAIILFIGYTLQLTDRFCNDTFEIHICTNIEKSELTYLLYVNDDILNYENNTVINSGQISSDLIIEKKYTLPCI